MSSLNKINTMTLDEALQALTDYRQAFGNVSLVLWDMDSSSYFTLTPKNIEAQRMEDGSVRVSIGPNSFSDPGEEAPAKRPLIFSREITADRLTLGGKQ